MTQLPALIRAKIARAPKGYLAVPVDLEELERWAQLAEHPHQDDLPDEIVVHPDRCPWCDKSIAQCDCTERD